MIKLIKLNFLESYESKLKLYENNYQKLCKSRVNSLESKNSNVRCKIYINSINCKNLI